MKKMFHLPIFFAIFVCVNCEDRYDRYSGRLVEEALEKGLRLKDASDKCTIEIRPCTPHEGSRVDGTCNNLKQPAKGSARGPYLRLLPPDYGSNNKTIRKSKNGSSLPSARLVRTTLQSTGRVDDKKTFTIAVPHFLEFIRRDVSALGGPRELKQRQNCCQPEGLEQRCEAISVPDNDPYLKVTNVRCLNFSRAETYQDAGCAPEIIPSEQINFQTPLLDLSTIYGVDEKALATVRAYKNGLLKLERKDEKHLPLPLDISTLLKTILANVSDPAKNTTISTESVNSAGESMLTMKSENASSRDVCIQNKDDETTCYQFGFPEMGNYDLRTTTFGIFFMREHNRLARHLHRLNPCWKDDRIFKVARQINIATASNILMYELLPLLLGYDNMVKYNLISDHVEQLTAYYEEEVPLVYSEFEIASRYFHTMLDGRLKKYDENLQLIDELSLSETLYRQGLLEKENNFGSINRGTFLQHAAKADDIQDPEISEKFYGDLQKAHDLSAIDIQRGRDLGVRGYNDYRQLCGLKTAAKFEDLLDVMDPEKVMALKKLYNSTEDIDLLAGIMSEAHVKGTVVGPTLFCIMAKQLQLWRFSDRFWFERGDQLHSFNLAQLHEIKRTNIARLACDNAEGIKYVQPRAFLNMGHGNTAVPCTHIYGLDLRKWTDVSCRREYEPLKTKDGSIKQNNGFEYQLNRGWIEKPDENRLNSTNDPNNMILDYTNFFEQLLSLRRT